MKKMLFRCLFYLQVHRVIRYLCRKKIVILLYHGFTDKTNHEGIENYNGKHVNVEKFRSQIEYLKKYHNVIPLHRLVEYYTEGAKIPDKSVVITFDDGYKSNYTLAYPILKQFDTPATIFPSTDFIENKEFLWPDRIEYAINMAKCSNCEIAINGETLSLDLNNNNLKMVSHRKIDLKLKSIPQASRPAIVKHIEQSLGEKLSAAKQIPEIYRPLEWQDVLEMVNSGIISIGGHTHTHVILTKCTPENMKREISLSSQIFEQRIGLRCRAFCYPNGQIGDFDLRTKNVVRQLGYSCASTTVHGFNDKHSNIFELKRFNISNDADLATFAMTLSGVREFFSKIKQALLKAIGFRPLLG